MTGELKKQWVTIAFTVAFVALGALAYATKDAELALTVATLGPIVCAQLRQAFYVKPPEPPAQPDPGIPVYIAPSERITDPDINARGEVQ
jgi:hypothetical protein